MNEKILYYLEMYGGALAILIGGLIIVSLIVKIERKALSKTKIDQALHTFICKATKVALILVLIIMFLTQLGVKTTSLITILGGGAAAIALALRDSLSNVAGGIIIMLNKPFCKGDTIELPSSPAPTMGMVDSIDLLTTKIHTYDNKVITIPNGTIITSVLTNYSREDTRRVDCVFGIGYDSDIKKAKEILREVADGQNLVIKEQDYIIGVSGHGDNSVTLDLKVWCKTEDYFTVKYYLEEEVKLRFDREGISIPYPQMDVHLKN